MLTYNKTLVFSAVILAVLAITAVACQQKTAEASGETAVVTPAEPSKEEMIKRGEYLVAINGCHDCHSPKLMSEHGPEPDPSKMLSGHPEGQELPEIDLSLMGKWVLFSMDLTAAVGPWGVSFAANLTPDDQTGIGGWSEDNFINAMRTGKHMGIPDGRPIMPPMPWFQIANMEDQDLKAVFAYLKSLPAIKNRVPEPISMDQIASSDKVKLAPKKS